MIEENQLALYKPTIARALRALSFAIARCRFSVLILIVGFAILMSDQGLDLLIAYGEDGKTIRLTVAAFFWALSIWGWARVLLDIVYEDLPKCKHCYNEIRKWLPRILGCLAFVAVGASAYRADQMPFVWWAAGGFSVFLVIVWARRSISRRLADWAKARGSEGMSWVARFLVAPPIDSSSSPPYRDLWAALQLPEDRSRWGEELGPRALIAAAVALAWLLFFLLATFVPLWLGAGAGAMIMFFIWGVTWLPVGSVLSYLADKHGIPLLTSLLVLALLSSLFNDNHEIRHAKETAGSVDGRKSVTQGLQDWKVVNVSQDGKPVPFVVVATAGGGIRAAFWTGTVLGALHDDNAQFSRQLFSLSGVSGGSLGATVYRALLEFETGELEEYCPGGMMSCTQNVLGRDFLGPVAAALLFPDLTQRFFPSSWFPDRGAALERGWEAAFEEETGADILSSSLVDLASKTHRPALFLNATWIDNGRRIVASNLRYARDLDPEAQAFRLSNDQLAVLGRDLRLSTAAHNSARFPLVSPPGMWKKDGKIEGRLQDGGLFENFGAETALEILDLACMTFQCVTAEGRDPAEKTTANEKTRVLPLVILISSDPSLPVDDEFGKSPTNPPIEFAYEVRATLRAFARTRSGRGVEAAGRLEKWTEAHNFKFFHFRMCDPKAEGTQPPLGWALSDAAEKRIKSYLVRDQDSQGPTCYTDNSQHRENIMNLLSAGSSPSTGIVE